MNLRNKPCACGSGKKTKFCCESPELKSKQYQELREEIARRAKERAERLERERKEFREKVSGDAPFIYRRASVSAMAWMAGAMSFQGGRK